LWILFRLEGVMNIFLLGLRWMRTGLLFLLIAAIYFFVSGLLLVSSPLLYGIYILRGEKGFYKVRSSVSR
jgi:hypothetical protein